MTRRSPAGSQKKSTGREAPRRRASIRDPGGWDVAVDRGKDVVVVTLARLEEEMRGAMGGNPGGSRRVEVARGDGAGRGHGRRPGKGGWEEGILAEG
jgi:hypothetical protein